MRFFVLLVGGALVAMGTGELLAADSSPQPRGGAERIAALIEQLGDNDYFVRERAQQELAALGVEAFDAICAAESHPDIEIAHRASYLVRSIRIDWVREGDPAEVRRLLENYESFEDERRAEVIKHLGTLPDARGVAALCRIVRFERSHVLSKAAAMRLIEQTHDELTLPLVIARVRDNIDGSPRPATQWLVTWMAAKQDAAHGAEAWGKLADAEARTLKTSPQHTSPELVLGLYRQQVALLRELGQRDDAVAAMMKMIDVDRSTSDTVNELLLWLVEEQAWPVVDRVAERFGERFQDEPMFLYTIAQARRAQGDTRAAQAAVDRALELNPGDQVQHYLTANALQKRGLVDWAEGEYRVVIDIGPPGQTNTLYAQFLLAEMLHDHGHDDRAADVLAEATAAMEANANQGRGFADGVRTLRENTARMHYFRAVHLGRQNETEKQVAELWEALGNDALEADVLIALYRIADLPAAERDKVRKMIRDATEVFRRRIQEEPDSDTHYNQLAWLVSNTEGDYQEALRCSLKSLDLRPNSAGLLDTLAHCYYALGDYKNAYQTQVRAVELDPHSGLLNRQLEVFRKAYEKNRDKPAGDDAR